MNIGWCILLGQEDKVPGVFRVVLIIILVAVFVLGHLIKKAKEWLDRQEAERQERQEAYGGEPARPEPVPAGEAEAALDAVLGTRRLEGERRRPAHEAEREETEPREEPPAEPRKSARVQRPRTEVLVPVGIVREGGVRVEVDWSDWEKVARAIVYSEILGPPKALRRGPESWER